MTLCIFVPLWFVKKFFNNSVLLLNMVWMLLCLVSLFLSLNANAEALEPFALQNYPC